MADPPLLGAKLGRHIYFMAKEEIFKFKLIGAFFRRVGAFSVRRGGLDRSALSKTRRILKQGKSLVIFPEGSRSPDAKLQPAFPGSAAFAVRSGAPVIPVGIIGTERLGKWTWILHRPTITVNIGKPFCLPNHDSKVGKDELGQYTDLIMRRVARLLPSKYRGVYSN